MSNNKQQTKWSQFTSLIIVFFFWGFVAASNDILIPVFKKWFVLSQLQSQLVAWAFYAAYFVGSALFFMVSIKRDLLQEFGYKKTLALGLSLSAIGALLFIPAAATANFWFFLTALFIVGLGFSVQQIVANPLAIKMGSPESGAHRLTMDGGINSLGTTIGPILVGIALFGTGNNREATPSHLNKTETLSYEHHALKKELEQHIFDLENDSLTSTSDKATTVTKIENQVKNIEKGIIALESNPITSEKELAAVADQLDITKRNASNIRYPNTFVKGKLKMLQVPFLVLGISFIIVAIFMLFSKIENPEKETESEVETPTQPEKPFKITQYPQLMLGMLAIFLYVGVEVSIISNLPALLHTREFGSVLESNIAPFVSLYWGSLMIGRWNGSVNVFNTSKIVNTLLKIIIPFVAFAIILGANTLSGKDVSAFFIYPIWISIFIIMSFLGGKNAEKTLMIFGVAGIIMMLLGLFVPDKDIAKYFFISGGLFCSIMWPAIFDLAIAGLGKNTGKASSFLIMMILGGGIIPLVQGAICDIDNNAIGKNGILGMSYTHFSYIIPALCFLYLAFYGYITPKILRKQGVKLEA